MCRVSGRQHVTARALRQRAWGWRRDAPRLGRRRTRPAGGGVAVELGDGVRDGVEVGCGIFVIYDCLLWIIVFRKLFLKKKFI